MKTFLMSAGLFLVFLGFFGFTTIFLEKITWGGFFWSVMYFLNINAGVSLLLKGAEK